VTNPHLTDFAHEIHIRRMQILSGSVTSLTNTSLAMMQWQFVDTACQLLILGLRHKVKQLQQWEKTNSSQICCWVITCAWHIH